MDQVKIGRFMAQLRKEQGLTQAQLGEKLGVTNKTISRWENGNYMPDLAAIPALAAQLGVSVSELLAGERFAEEEYKRSADEQLLKVMRMIDDIRDFRSCCGLIEGMGSVALIMLLPILLFMSFVPMYLPSLQEEEHSLLLLFVSLAVFGAGLALFLLRRKHFWLTGLGLIMLFFCGFWYNSYEAYTSGVLFLPIYFGLICIALSILGYRSYFRKIDELLEETKEQ